MLKAALQKEARQKVSAYLLAWNPRYSDFENMDEQIRNVAKPNSATERWSCGNTRNIPRNSRVFLMRLGKAPKGIVGSGWVERATYSDKHWNLEKARSGQVALYIDVRFDVLARTPLVRLDELALAPFDVYRWVIQKSGVRLSPSLQNDLEKLWLERNQTKTLSSENTTPHVFYEGTIRTILVNSYERDPTARAACIAHYGARCCICNFDFGAIYGALVAGFIQVHHLVPLSQIGTAYYVDPVRDLRPVCPNCHSVLHQQTPPLSIEYVKNLLKT